VLQTVVNEFPEYIVPITFIVALSYGLGNRKCTLIDRDSRFFFA